MAWKWQATSRSIEVDVDIGEEFTGEQNLQCLIDRGWITEDEAHAIAKRANSKAPTATTPIFGLDTDDDEFQDAKHFIMLGRRDEALIHLERFLGRDFVGRLT